MDQATPSPAAEDDAPTGARVLVIDDEEVIHASLQRILGRRGHHVDCALSGATALEQLADNQYDLIITDLMMPEMDGLQLLERLGDLGVSAPVLMITGYPTIGTAVKALRLGAVDYLAKPFTRKELLAPVNRALRRGPSEPATTSELAEGSSPLAKDGAAPDFNVVPGDRFYLRDHSWLVYCQDGTVEVGIEASFLGGIRGVSSITLPRVDDLLEQGYVGISLETADGESHGVFMPVTGQVVEVHQAAPAELDHSQWLVRVLPGRLNEELPLLARS